MQVAKDSRVPFTERFRNLVFLIVSTKILAFYSYPASGKEEANKS